MHGDFLAAFAISSLPRMPIALVLSQVLMLEIMKADVHSATQTFALLLKFLDGPFYCQGEVLQAPATSLHSHQAPSLQDQL